MNKRILIVDDEPHVVRVLARALERAGYAVTQAGNGVDALERALADPPDALITDIQMPKLDGRGLCEALQRHFPAAPFLIFVHTSRTEIEHREWSSAMPNIRFLEKPASVRKLLSMLETELAASEPAGSGAAGA